MSYERVSKADVQRAFARHAELLQQANAIGEGNELCIDAGSKVNGIAWRLYEIGTDRTVEGWSGHRSPLVGSDYLGMTAREAYEELGTRSRVIADLLYVQRQQQEQERTTQAAPLSTLMARVADLGWESTDGMSWSLKGSAADHASLLYELVDALGLAPKGEPAEGAEVSK